VRPRPTISRLTDAEREAHEAFIRTLGGNVLWREYLGEEQQA
jgi:DNA polymerase-3 subunit epsilon